jgi:hypothetical protein
VEAKLTRRLAGARAKAIGASFEGMFERWCQRDLVTCTRMPDGCKQIGPRRIIRVTTPWDYVLTHRGTSALIDTKTTAAKAFSHSMIKEHQVQEMFRHHNSGAKAGYVIWFQASDRIIFVPVSDLLRRMSAVGSISDIAGTHLGSASDLYPSRIFNVG